MGGFATVTIGRERWNARESVPRHRHDRAYAAVVLSGSYGEWGSRGRFRVGPGDALVHDAFDAHLDRFGNSGAQILNLVVDGWSPAFSVGHVADPDAIARTAERDVIEAGAQLREQLEETEHAAEDWQDELAIDLLGDPGRRLDAWARAHGIAAETVSRGFGKVFGVTPAAFRLEVRTRQAFAIIARSDAPLAVVAATTGFSDQAHMSRAVRALTGVAPGWWRRSNRFKTRPPVAP